MAAKWNCAVGLFCRIVLLSALALLAWTGASAADRPAFPDWLQGVQEDMIAQGISVETAAGVLGSARLVPRVLELDRRQPEFTLSVAEYMDRIVSPRRIARGRQEMQQHEAVLREIGRRYGVPPRFIVALWGIESNYGRNMGGFPVVDAVVSLAYEGRRAAFFRKELFHVLQILDAGHIPQSKMMGSWAGAMGQVQFMPSSFMAYGVDHDRDARIDLWSSTPDSLASAANYLARAGWVSGCTWGREVAVPEGFSETSTGLKVRKRLTEWRALGVKCAGGRALPHKPDLEAALIAPDGRGGRHYLVYQNYRVLLRWNNSQHFALAVGTLADLVNQ